jgi:hypothetical protein
VLARGGGMDHGCVVGGLVAVERGHELVGVLGGQHVGVCGYVGLGVRRLVVTGVRRVGGLVGEHGDAQHERVGDLDAGERSVLGYACESGGEDLVRAPAVVLAGLVDGGHERGPGGCLLQVVGLGRADEFSQCGTPGGLQEVRGVLICPEGCRPQVRHEAPPQGGGLLLVGQRARIGRPRRPAERPGRCWPGAGIGRGRMRVLP